jgi:hypothetical protein
MSAPSRDDVGIDGPRDDKPRCYRCNNEIGVSAFETIDNRDYCFYCAAEVLEEENQ